MTLQAPADWYADPFGRHEHRYWDGLQWTEHVASAGQQAVDAPIVPPPPQHSSQPVNAAAAQPASTRLSTANMKVRRQVRKLGVDDDTRAGGGTLFTERVLVVNQKAKLFEKRAEYSVFNQSGQKIGAVREFGHSLTRMTMGQDNATRRLQITDADGRAVLILTRPAVFLKSKVIVTRHDGTPVGQIVQENLGLLASTFGGRFNIRFRLESAGQTLGSINAESWQAWDFSIQDPTGAEIGRITKTWAGLGKTMFTKADNYVLEIHRPLQDPLLTLVVSAAIAVDTVLHQNSD